MRRFLGYIFLTLLTVLLHYTEAACKGDTSIILKFGWNQNISGAVTDITWYFNGILIAIYGVPHYEAFDNFKTRLFQVSSSEPDLVNLNLSQPTDEEEGTYRCLIQQGQRLIYLNDFSLKLYRAAEPNPLNLTSVSDNGSNACLCPNLRSLGDNELYLATKKNYPAIAVLDNTTAFKHTFTNESSGTYFWFLRKKYQEDNCTTVHDIPNNGCYWPGISTTGSTPNTEMVSDHCKCVPCLVFVILLAVLFALLLIYAVVYVVMLKKQTDTRRGWFIRDIVLIVLAVVELVFSAITIGLCFGMKGCYKDCKPNGTDGHLFRATIIFLILGIGAVINAVLITIITKKSQ